MSKTTRKTCPDKRLTTALFLPKAVQVFGGAEIEFSVGDGDAAVGGLFVDKGGIRHHVGLTIHDASGRDLRPDRPLEAGMVFANDIWGWYTGEDLGVRIENTVLITETGCEILHPGIPREVDEIEALMRSNASDK